MLPHGNIQCFSSGDFFVKSIKQTFFRGVRSPGWVFGGGVVASASQEGSCTYQHLSESHLGS
jgi:formylmethanofuran:tetrahydromethanopterin formyltransferase